MFAFLLSGPMASLVLAAPAPLRTPLRENASSVPPIPMAGYTPRWPSYT